MTRSTPSTPPASCADCERRAGPIFCNLPDGPFRVFDAVKQTRLYDRDEWLFMEGDEPEGVFLVCSGRVKLSASSSEGRTMILQIASHGELLGVPAAVNGRPHTCSAQALEPAHLKFVRRADFLEMSRSWGAVSYRVVQALCGANDCAQDRVRSLGLAESASERVARFLLDRCALDGRRDERGVHLTLTLTHQEIGQLVGISRETVSRTLTRFRAERLISGAGARLLVPDPAALEALVHI